ncbi:MAG TPA: cupin domain-containing protein [Beijerinckiaceae bacterium]|nr:cupin domain-containing protein [Beijerinckiaceae bacterium]
MAGAAQAILGDLEAKLARHHLRGQWQADSNRPQSVRKDANGVLHIEPVASGKPHVWRWSEVEPILGEACDAMPESHTARRSLILTNPGLPRGTTHTLLTGFQIVRPGEVAWAHRHTINALRFSIRGGPDVYTVVEGRQLTMEPYDLLLTPGWTWHDHHNDSGRDAIWLDGLDVPFTLALNQNFYDELGDVSQDVTECDSLTPLMVRSRADRSAASVRPFRYPWADTQRLIDAHASDPIDPCDGRAFEFVDPRSGGSVLPTIACQIQVLPPGFDGRIQRRTASATAFVIAGEGRVVLSDDTLSWSRHDSFVLPNWTRYRLVNASQREPALIFTMSDRPMLDAFGFYREETEGGDTAPSLAAKTPIGPAVERASALS